MQACQEATIFSFCHFLARREAVHAEATAKISCKTTGLTQKKSKLPFSFTPCYHLASIELNLHLKGSWPAVKAEVTVRHSSKFLQVNPADFWLSWEEGGPKLWVQKLYMRRHVKPPDSLKRSQSCPFPSLHAITWQVLSWTFISKEAGQL